MKNVLKLTKGGERHNYRKAIQWKRGPNWPDNAWAMSILSKGSRCGTRQGPSAHGVLYSDWQFLKVLSSYCPRNIEGQLPPHPEVCRADVWWRFPKPTPALTITSLSSSPIACRAGSDRATAPGKPPKERMGVEQ